ncbi:MAG TPA: PilX N-terminal domain-containing pilus assembly protein, partial [Candidatus Hydrogenedentes bacterium]|nr:PilX N-terminal domain-containing pilus assembly protein [Candidatus Hydrogenedentota bacterium]
MRRRRGTRGQALVIAIFILAFLTAIAIALFTSTRLQLRRALNLSNRIQAAQAAEAGLAMAQAFLRHDGYMHTTATSYDFAFKTYFNGAAFAG